MAGSFRNGPRWRRIHERFCRTRTRRSGGTEAHSYGRHEQLLFFDVRSDPGQQDDLHDHAPDLVDEY